jgi:hypothetical protein
MRTKIYLIVLVGLSLMRTFTLYAAGQEETILVMGYGNGLRKGAGNGGGNRSYNSNNDRFVTDLEQVLINYETSELNETEIEELVHMWQEEKLARDVYTSLYEIWNLPLFANISASEQQHLDAVSGLFRRYELSVPGDQSDLGNFPSQEFQNLYNDLVDQGKQSLSDALEVGATIEDLDISDLILAIKETDNDDLKILYQNLLKASRNHMRSFDRQLARLGIEYQAQFIDQDYLQRIRQFNTEIAVIDDPDYVF